MKKNQESGVRSQNPYSDMPSAGLCLPAGGRNHRPCGFINEFTGDNKTLLYAAFFIFAFASAASAAGSEAHAGDWKEWLWKIVNFGILVFVLVRFVGKPLKDFLRQRSELIEKTMRDADAARQAAEQALAGIEEKLRLKDREIEEIMAQSRKTAEHEHELLISQAMQMKERMLEQARSSIDYETRLAKEEIKAEAAEAAVVLAEKKIKERLNPEVHSRLTESSISMVESGR